MLGRRRPNTCTLTLLPLGDSLMTAPASSPRLHLDSPVHLAAATTDSPLALAKSAILAPSGLDESRLEQVLGTAATGVAGR